MGDCRCSVAVSAAHAIPIDLLLNDTHVDKKSCSFDFVVELENLWVLWLYKTLALLNSKSENILFGLFQK
jgi:hypothetical protein